MINAILNWLRVRLGHWLLADEEADEKRREQEIARRQAEIINADYETSNTADDFDRGEF